ncbi:MAG TPA: RNA-binding S4 domain-containing protein [Chitinophagaceae bacterium]|nr:RNA-binding S4 domain-containing protein [Chitinophagaceae bacterium]MCC6634048.1 RNA-binding S4 domain-containing protein [Chitinophagaceae bacterium]HMZ45654.1 RNA-binding S4 domain-containing protein [Chitinophagaceae bacterium]HNF29051.1 RNA-binding S4 domain-containing protein [Chitinophagaceae bacterium]HNJ57483.1 RNA-binding S4 domain-containing protein [Chitinophagaceae bacterium]
MSSEKTRIDKYLWAIRLFKTRSLATEACDKGRVKLNGVTVKAAKTVHLNEEYEIKTEARKWVIKVNGLLNQRVAYTEAIKFYTDITPPEEKATIEFKPVSFHTGKILSKIGRPTKKQRRDIDNFINFDEDEN